MKRKILSLTSLVLVVLLILCACGSSSKDSKDSGAEDAAVSSTSESADETKDAETTSDVHPYAWLGLEEMPQCDYLDAVSSSHYYRVYDTYVSSFVTESKEAVDGVNTYTESSGNRTYSIDGKILSVNDSSKMYMESDMSSTIDVAKKSLEDAMKTGKNLKGRAFVEKGSGTIPSYSEKGDTAKYEYYEYDYPETKESTGMTMTERFYMKDGDVFAIWQKTDTGDSSMEMTEVIKSISKDIPKGTFDLPDLDGYKKYE